MVVHSAQVYIQLKPLFSRHNGIGVQFTDEPTGNLDSASGAQILAILKQLNQEGRTVILITHDDSIARSAQRIIRIQDGKIAKNCALAFIDNSPDYAIMDAGFEKAKTLP